MIYEAFQKESKFDWDVIASELVTLENQCFEKAYHELEDFKARLENRSFLILIARDESSKKAVAFKVGYEEGPHEFYSWIGGVIPEFRGQGLALSLMEKQHQWLKENSYQVVRTHTENQFKNMLILNIKSGFDIVEIIKKGDRQKIVLERKLAK